LPTLPDSPHAVDETPAPPAASAHAETLHEVLATQARGRTTLELSAGAVIGAANAALIWARFPSVHWLAAGFAATAGYGLWGLLDRKLRDLGPGDARSSTLISVGRWTAGAAGWIAALFAVASFLTAALSSLSLPGR
jgi:hypothetical protein